MDPSGEDQEPQFTLSILSENETNALIRLAMTLARHRIRIESLTTRGDEAIGVFRHILVVRALPDRVRRAMKQIGATVGVLAAGYYREGETIDREVGLYKLNADLGGDADRLRDLVRSRRARVLVRDEHSLVVELTGCGYEIEEFYESLRPFGVMEFVRSGRVMVTREPQANSSGVRIAQGHRANGG